jgi:hypothetical protein
MRGRQIALALTLIIGVVLLIYSLYIGVMIGSDWYGSQANFQWHMNNYIVMDAKYAYSIFGLATMAIGGLASGVAISSLFMYTKTKKHMLILAAAFFIAILMTGLGFNTLDFMLGCFYWTNQTYPPPVQIFLFGSVDVWNFYFFFFVVPLWFSGFLMGGSTAYYTFIYQPRRAAAAYLAKKNLTGMLSNTAQKGYVAESKVFWRSRKPIIENFDKTN